MTRQQQLDRLEVLTKHRAQLTDEGHASRLAQAEIERLRYVLKIPTKQSPN